MKYSYLILILLILNFLNCEKNPVSSEGIQATGTFSIENVDKDKWGDFLLVLELNKKIYSKNDPIKITFTFKNTVNKAIILDGILPYRSSANPPYLDIFTQNGRKYKIDKIESNLVSDKKNIVESGKNLTLMNINLKNVGGTILTEDMGGYVAEEKENIGSEFIQGEYLIQGHFHPTPQVYFSDTDTLSFKIEK